MIAKIFKNKEAYAILFIGMLLLAGKLSGVVDAPWVLVLLPFWFPFALLGIIVFAILLIAFFSVLFQKDEPTKN